MNFVAMVDWGVRNGVPYCGPAPAPADLIGAWNFAPLLIAILPAAAGAYARFGPRSTGQRIAFAGGLAALAVAYISPLCAWSVALFSARAAHHIMIVAVAAPLLAIGIGWRRRLPLVPLVAVQTLVLWLWHAPVAYDWALSSDVGYWTMELSLLVTAFGAWQASLATDDPPKATASFLFSMVQMGLLGALITFAPQPLYLWHAPFTLLWGLSPLADQQLAGLLMWTVGALPYLFAALAVVGRWLALEGRQAPSGRS